MKQQRPDQGLSILASFEEETGETTGVSAGNEENVGIHRWTPPTAVHRQLAFLLRPSACLDQWQPENVSPRVLQHR